jgi:hypothetical protein
MSPPPARKKHRLRHHHFLLFAVALLALTVGLPHNVRANKPNYYVTPFSGTYRDACVAGCAAMGMVPACIDGDDVGPGFAQRLSDSGVKK